MSAGSPPAGGVTALLQAWGRGEIDARNRLFTIVYEELRRCAAGYVRRERAGQSLEPTVLVNEAYLRLAAQDRMQWQNRAQFLGVAAKMMRRILVDRARARNSAKRSGRWARVTLHEAIALQTARQVEVLDLDRALVELKAFDERKSQIAELRFFGGLSLEETGQVLGLSVATVEREWRTARAWLHAWLTKGPAVRAER